MKKYLLSVLTAFISISAGAQVSGVSSSTKRQVSDAVDNAYNKSRNSLRRKSTAATTSPMESRSFSSRPSSTTGKPTASQKKATDEKAVREYNQGVDAWNKAVGTSTFNQDRINDIFNSKAQPKGMSGAELRTAAAYSKNAKNSQNMEQAYKGVSDAFHNNSGQIKWDEVIKHFGKMNAGQKQHYYNQAVKEYKTAKFKYDELVSRKTRTLKGRIYSETKVTMDEKKLNNMLKTGTSNTIDTYVNRHYPKNKTQAASVGKTVKETAVFVQSSSEAQHTEKKKKVLDILRSSCPECAQTSKVAK